MAPRPDVSNQRRNQILDAAMAVFARMGFERARMDDIADEAGVSKGALYLYYKSKDAIIATLLQFFFDRAIKQVRAFAADNGPVTAQILTMTREMTREMERMAAIQPVSLQFYAIAARQSAVRQHLRVYFAEYRGVLEGIIQRGIAQEEFRPTISPSEVAITISALLEGLALLWLVDPQGADWRRQVEISVHHLLQGIVTGPMPST
jgi:AcrR family transcriptional regulator